jgi:hypothetical protein
VASSAAGGSVCSAADSLAEVGDAISFSTEGVDSVVDDSVGSVTPDSGFSGDMSFMPSSP